MTRPLLARRSARLGRRALIPVVPSLVAVTLVAGPALAFYGAAVSGTVSAGATAATVAPLSVTITSSSAAKLYPGGPAGDVRFTVTNNAPRSVQVTGIGALSGTATGGCTPAITATQPAAGQLFTLTAGQTLTGVLFSGVVTMGTGASSNCQGKTITITITLTGKY